MRLFACLSCRQTFKSRLHRRISELKQLRNEYHPSPPLRQTRPLPSLPSRYWDTLAPTPRQLRAASYFFRTHPPHKLWTASEWRHLNDDNDGALTPEVAFLGRSNVGKSSLLNELLYSPGLNYVGDKPGKTKVMHAWTLSARNPKTGGAVKGMGGDIDNKVTILDAPGYGFASQWEWGNEIVKYLGARKQLRRVFLLMDAMHGVKPADFMMLKLLREQRISHQVIASKCDRLEPISKRQQLLADATDKIKEAVQPTDGDKAAFGLGEILAVGFMGDRSFKKKRPLTTTSSIEAVQWAVLRAVGLDDFAVTLFEKSPESSPGEANIGTGNEKILSMDMNSQPRQSLGAGTDTSWAHGNSVAGVGNWKLPDWLLDLDEPQQAPSLPRQLPGTRDIKPLQLNKLDRTRDRLSSPFTQAQVAVRPKTNPSQGLNTRFRSSEIPPSASATKHSTAKVLTSPSKPRTGSIGRGIDDLLSMTGTALKTPPQPKRKSPVSKRKQTNHQQQQREQDLLASLPSLEPLPRGPGVSRGIDALLALTGATQRPSSKTGGGVSNGAAAKRRMRSKAGT